MEFKESSGFHTGPVTLFPERHCSRSEARNEDLEEVADSDLDRIGHEKIVALSAGFNTKRSALRLNSNIVLLNDSHGSYSPSEGSSDLARDRKLIAVRCCAADESAF